MDHDMQSPIESNESDYGLSSPDANSKNIDSSLLDPIEIAEAVSASSLTSHPSTSIVGNFNPHPLGKDPRRADHVVKWSLENIVCFLFSICFSSIHLTDYFEMLIN